MPDSHDLSTIFGASRALIGMLHVEALPGTPRGRLPVEAIAEKAVAEAAVYRRAGFNGLMIENMHDRPYLKGGVGPEVVAAMTVVAREVRRASALPLGRPGPGRSQPRGGGGGARRRGAVRAGRGLRLRPRRRRGADRGLGRRAAALPAGDRRRRRADLRRRQEEALGARHHRRRRSGRDGARGGAVPGRRHRRHRRRHRPRGGSRGRAGGGRARSSCRSWSARG